MAAAKSYIFVVNGYRDGIIKFMNDKVAKVWYR